MKRREIQTEQLELFNGIDSLLVQDMLTERRPKKKTGLSIRTVLWRSAAAVLCAAAIVLPLTAVIRESLHRDQSAATLVSRPVDDADAARNEEIIRDIRAWLKSPFENIYWGVSQEEVLIRLREKELFPFTGETAARLAQNEECSVCFYPSQFFDLSLGESAAQAEVMEGDAGFCSVRLRLLNNPAETEEKILKLLEEISTGTEDAQIRVDIDNRRYGEVSGTCYLQELPEDCRLYLAENGVPELADPNLVPTNRYIHYNRAACKTWYYRPSPSPYPMIDTGYYYSGQFLCGCDPLAGKIAEAIGAEPSPWVSAEYRAMLGDEATTAALQFGICTESPYKVMWYLYDAENPTQAQSERGGDCRIISSEIRVTVEDEDGSLRECTWDDTSEGHVRYLLPGRPLYAEWQFCLEDDLGNRLEDSLRVEAPKQP